MSSQPKYGKEWVLDSLGFTMKKPETPETEPKVNRFPKISKNV